jgi:HAD superfamily hydrolase (TIGR01484 family)
MRFVALACDYDGTLAANGHVGHQTLEALLRLQSSGRQCLLVTGRERADLTRAFSDLHLFRRVVVENGAVLYRPAGDEEKLLAPPPPENFVSELRRRGVAPISVGQSIVATWEPHETIVLEVIRDLGLELQVIFNKGAVMVLPSGVNKATGLTAALDELGVSAHQVVGIGDAENDHAFLDLCGCSVAVANALPAIKARATFTTQGVAGQGVIELIEELIDNDLARVQPRPAGP